MPLCMMMAWSPKNDCVALCCERLEMQPGCLTLPMRRNMTGMRNSTPKTTYA